MSRRGHQGELGLTLGFKQNRPEADGSRGSKLYEEVDVVRLNL